MLKIGKIGFINFLKSCTLFTNKIKIHNAYNYIKSYFIQPTYINRKIGYIIYAIFGYYKKINTNIKQKLRKDEIVQKTMFTG